MDKSTQDKGKGFIFEVIVFIVIIAVAIMSLPNGSVDNQTVSNSSTSSSSAVSNSSWDASVYQVKNYIKNNAKDPKSIEYIEWSSVVKNSNNNYTVRVKYRAKNSFGAFTVENKLFTLDSSGNVMGFKDFS